MNAASAEIFIHPEMEFPADRDLPDLPGLFDGEWVWQKLCEKFGEQEFHPNRLLIQGVSHTRGKEAIVTYEAEWPDDAYLPNERFTFQMGPANHLRISCFPDDEYLPGLGEACDPESALRLVSRHVMSISPRRMRVQVIRYRPRSHAVLRHRMGRSRLYVRVVRPSTVPAILESAELIGRSGFAVPRLAGLWPEGGVLWFSEIPGKNLRGLIKRGDSPPSSLILDALESLWTVSGEDSNSAPFNLPGAYRRARAILRHSVSEDEGARQEYRRAVQALDQFIESWRPTGIAHNDFYDDQMVVLPDGKISLVDIEGVGPGEPMLDVGNFLAHLKWASRVSGRGSSFGEYHDAFREESLERFRWTEEELDMREAVCLFRICTNAVRHPREDWRERLATGLSVVNKVLT